MHDSFDQYARLGTEFLPVSYEEMTARGWDYYDFLYICGDAYVDHPSFGAAIISRDQPPRHSGYGTAASGSF